MGMVSNYSQTIRAVVFAEQAGGAWVGGAWAWVDVAKKNHNVVFPEAGDPDAGRLDDMERLLIHGYGSEAST